MSGTPKLITTTVQQKQSWLKTIEQLEQLGDRQKERGAQTAGGDEPAEAELAQWWLDCGTTPSVTHRPPDTPHHRKCLATPTF